MGLAAASNGLAPVTDHRHPLDQLRYSWTQPACNSCWAERHPGREVHKLIAAEEEVCVYCGTETKSGIYVRIDPREAAFPTRLKD